MSSTTFPKPPVAKRTNQARRRRTYAQGPNIPPRLNSSVTSMHVDIAGQTSSQQVAAANTTVQQHTGLHHNNSQNSQHILFAPHHNTHETNNMRSVTSSSPSAASVDFDNDAECQGSPSVAAVNFDTPVQGNCSHLPAAFDFDNDAECHGSPSAAAVNFDTEGQCDSSPLAAAVNFDNEIQCDQDEFDDICTDTLPNITSQHTEHISEDISEDIPQVNIICPCTTLSSPALLRQIRQGIRYVVSWDRVLSYLSLHGRVIFTKYHYSVIQLRTETIISVTGIK